MSSSSATFFVISCKSFSSFNAPSVATLRAKCPRNVAWIRVAAWHNSGMKENVLWDERLCSNENLKNFEMSRENSQWSLPRSVEPLQSSTLCFHFNFLRRSFYMRACSYFPLFGKCYLIFGILSISTTRWVKWRASFIYSQIKNEKESLINFITWYTINVAKHNKLLNNLYCLSMLFSNPQHSSWSSMVS